MRKFCDFIVLSVYMSKLFNSTENRIPGQLLSNNGLCFAACSVLVTILKLSTQGRSSFKNIKGGQAYNITLHHWLLWGM